jgi:hypothetical protein
MKNKIMKSIERFRFQSLNNIEFTLVVSYIVSIAGKYPVVSLQLGKRFDALRAFLPDLDKINKW